ncbi:hypothetical protein [Actinokineospora enzanensis]|uniref:hypothetical protein n=1 Tax=Actinokineospora enzanensis TaxID=155975 RepID=UPI00036FDAEF|nr:hypothetical protein [Actinokineospora enzanensis]
MVELLDAIEQRLSGETDEAYEANGNAWFVLITKDRLEIENKYSEPLTGTVTMDLALTVLRAYWDVFDEPAIEKGKRDFRKYNHREPHLPW